MSELPASPDAGRQSQEIELLRVWVEDQDLHCSLQADAFPDAGNWGAILADVARYVARALQEQEGKDPAETARLIRSAFNEELDSPAGEGENTEQA